MKATQLLHNLGQSLWLDNITRDLLRSGTLKEYIDNLSVTGLTSNPTIFDHAIKNSAAYDAAITEKSAQGKAGEALVLRTAQRRATGGVEAELRGARHLVDVLPARTGGGDEIELDRAVVDRQMWRDAEHGSL